MAVIDQNVKELALEFKGTGEVRGFNFKQVKSTDKGYVYEVSVSGATWHEVFKRTINKQYGG